MEDTTKKNGCLHYVTWGLGLVTIIVGGGVYLAYKANLALNKYIDEPVIERVNIRGDTKPELFIDRKGKRFYAEIDGISIEDLLN